MLKFVKCVLCLPGEEPQQVSVVVRNNRLICDSFFGDVKYDFDYPVRQMEGIKNKYYNKLADGLKCVSVCPKEALEGSPELNVYATIIMDCCWGGPVLYYHISWKAYALDEHHTKGTPEITDLTLSDFMVLYGHQKCKNTIRFSNEEGA